MKVTDVIKKLSEYKNGALIKVTYESDLNKYLKDKSYTDRIKKETIFNWRKGIKYSNQKSVIEKIESGKRTFTNLPPKGFNPVYPTTISHEKCGAKIFISIKSHEFAVQFFDLPNNPNKPVSKYYLDNKEITWTDLIALDALKESYVNPKTPRQIPDARIVYVKNIKDISSK